METKLNKKSVKDVDVTGKRVLLRVDFNVPLNENGSVMDDEKIVGALPTIQYLIKKGAKVIVVSHLGRPEGRAVENLRLTAVAERLSQHLGKPVKKMNDCIGDDVKKAVANMKEGSVIVLENLRFHKEEEANNEAFAKSLASLADIFVNDAFGSVHRAHASTVGVTKFLPSVAGLLVEKEIKIMGKALHKPDRPFVVIMGGSKVADKIDVLKNLSDKADTLLIGGGMAFTFLKAQGYEIGKSIVEKDKVGVARDILKEYEAKGKKVILPADVVVSSGVDKVGNNTKIKTVAIDKIPPDLIGVDIGPKTVTLFVKEIKKAKTIIWNGPMGVFEVKEFAQGSLAIAKALAASGALTIVGGGDTVAAVEQSGVAKKITHLSTGGGASLEFLEGKELPGISALSDK